MSSTTTSDSITTISVKLGESNYQSWVVKMRALLMSKKLWMYVKGDIPRPSASDSSLSDWLSNAYAAAGLILLSLEDSQHTHVADMEDDPVLMWKTLEDVHVQKRPNSRFMAYSSLLSITKQSEESLPSVTTRIEQAMKDIKALRPKGYTLEQLDDDLSCMAMLRSLGPEYSFFVSVISLMDSISMEKLKTAFITEESNRKATQQYSGPTSSTANFTSTQSKHKSSKSRPVCKWCDATGHTEDRCYAKQASQQQDREGAKLRLGGKSWQPKHSSNSTPSIPSNSTVNTAQTPSKITEFAVNASTLLSTGSLTPRSDWCVDSGCSSHMTPHRNWFDSYTPHVVPILIANGTIIHSAGIGSVTFKPVVKGQPVRPVVLHNALHVPALSVSIRKVTRLGIEPRTSW